MPSAWLDRGTLQEANAADIAHRGAVQVARLQQARADAAAATPPPPEAPAVDFGTLIETLSAPFRDAPAANSAAPAAQPATPRQDSGGMDFGSLTRSLGSIFRDPEPAPTAAPAFGMPRTSAPAVPGSSDQTSTAPQVAGVREEDPGDLEAWARQEAIRLGIDPEIAVRVAAEGEGGFADPVRQSDIVYQGQREQSYGPYQLNMTGGLGTAALARGIDARNPRHARAGITYALEHAAQNGWGNFHGAARIGIGPWDGIGGRPSVPAQAPVQAAPAQQQPSPQAAQQPQQQPGAPAGELTPNQYTIARGEGLDEATADAVCGPAAAIAFARANGRNPTMREALTLAKQVGWTPELGMAGPASQVQLLKRMGIAATLVDGPPDWEKVRADVQRGNPVTISTPGHYFVVERVDPDTGMFDLGNSAMVLKAAGGRRWFRPEEIEQLGMGAPRGTIFKDSPNSPSPSVVAGRSGF